jgi:general secretion pathway protein L
MTMLKLDSRANQELAKFFQWWGGELLSLIPEKIRGFFLQERAKLVLTRVADGLALTLAEHGSNRVIGEFSFDEDGVKRREALFQENPALLEAELVLKLADDQCLLRHLKLPAAAEENLKQVVAFEMDRWTPFKAEQVYFGTRVTERLPDTKQIRFELALTPKQKLDPLIDEVIAAGWRPERVDIGPEPEGHGMDLLPERFRPHRSRVPQIVTGIAATILLLILGAAFAVPITMNRSMAEELRLEVKKASKVAEEVETLKKEVERQRNEHSFLSRKKRNEPTMLDMLNELTKVMPDDTWLNGLQYRDRKVTVQGQSPAASSLIERIEASDVFKNTSFVSPVTKDVASGQERFQITSEVTSRGASEKPTE